MHHLKQGIPTGMVSVPLDGLLLFQIMKLVIFFKDDRFFVA